MYDYDDEAERALIRATRSVTPDVVWRDGIKRLATQMRVDQEKKRAAWRAAYHRRQMRAREGRAA